MSSPTFTIDDRVIGRNKTYIIAEIGQNHQGDICIAKELIAEAKRCGADCVKFQKSCLPAKFTASALARPYNSPHSWGASYGAHKQHLEFSLEQYVELQRYAEHVGIAFTASAMDEVSLEQLYGLRVPFVKIGSGDGNNFQLIAKASRRSLPLIVSTGMQKELTVRRIVDILRASGKRDFCLLHCVSAYPTRPEHVNLRLLDVYRNWFPDVCLGYSGHEQGIWISVAAVLLGAKVVERHFTLDKRQRGNDHSLSLEPGELRALINAIRWVDKKLESNPLPDSNDATIVEILSEITGFNAQSDPAVIRQALKPIATKKILNCEIDCFNKLGKSLVFRECLKAGTKINENHLCAKVSEPNGIPADQISDFIGQELVKSVQADDLVSKICFKKVN